MFLECKYYYWLMSVILQLYPSGLNQRMLLSQKHSYNMVDLLLKVLFVLGITMVYYQAYNVDLYILGAMGANNLLLVSIQIILLNILKNIFKEFQVGTLGDFLLLNYFWNYDIEISISMHFLQLNNNTNWGAIRK